MLGGLGVFCRLCMLGDSLLRYPHGKAQSVDVWCTKNSTGALVNRYCKTTNFTQVCAEHFTHDNISIVVGIPGMSSGTFHSMSIVHMAVTLKNNTLEMHYRKTLQNQSSKAGPVAHFTNICKSLFAEICFLKSVSLLLYT